MPDPDYQSNSGSKLITHFIEEISWSTLIALSLVAFFFFFGCTNGLIKFLGRDVASIDFPIGPVIGIISSVVFLIIGTVIKLRRRS